VLGEIARTDEAPLVREAAVRRLTDQVVLGEIARTDEDDDVREAAVKKVTDQAVLGEIATTNTGERASYLALDKVTNQTSLGEIVRTAEDDDIRELALLEITDQAVLGEIARTARDWDTRQEAVIQLTDQALLSEIARTAQDPDVRSAAIQGLTDQAFLSEIARTAQEWDERRTAVGRLTNQALIEEIARTDEDEYVRAAAVRRLTDQAVLEEIAKTDESELVRTLAVGGREETSLRPICSREDYLRMRQEERSQFASHFDAMLESEFPDADFGYQSFPELRYDEMVLSTLISDLLRSGQLVSVGHERFRLAPKVVRATQKKVVRPDYPDRMLSTIPPEARSFQVDEDCEVLPFLEYDCPVCHESLGDIVPSHGPNVIVRCHRAHGVYLWWSIVPHCGRKLLIGNTGV
jgi:hypothetical protein